MADTVVIIVTWNSANVIRSCLESLRTEAADVVVADNASSDVTLRTVREAVPAPQLIANTQNLGFAAAVNAAIRANDQHLIALLNPDTVLAPRAITRLREALIARPDAAAAGGLLVDAAGQPQVGFCVRRFPTLPAMIFEALLLNRLWPNNPVNRRYRCLDLDHTQPAEVDQPAGAFLLLRRAALEQIGFFDERFHPLWFEDVDLCRRLKAAGWAILYCPAARARHSGGHSLELLAEADIQRYWYRNLLRYFAKHHGRGRTALLRIAVAAGMLLRLMALVIARPPRGTSRSRAARAYWSVFKTCWTSV